MLHVYLRFIRLNVYVFRVISFITTAPLIDFVPITVQNYVHFEQITTKNIWYIKPHIKNGYRYMQSSVCIQNTLYMLKNDTLKY